MKYLIIKLAYLVVALLALSACSSQKTEFAKSAHYQKFLDSFEQKADQR